MSCDDSVTRRCLRTFQVGNGTPPLAVRARGRRHFQEIAHWLLPEPGEVRRLTGLDAWGSTRALRGAVGGDHFPHPLRAAP